MRKLLILSALSLATAGTTGCFHNNCRMPGAGLFGSRQPTPAAMPVQCCQPVQCCDPCAGGGMPGPVMSAPMAAPCCQ